MVESGKRRVKKELLTARRHYAGQDEVPHNSCTTHSLPVVHMRCSDLYPHATCCIASCEYQFGFRTASQVLGVRKVHRSSLGACMQTHPLRLSFKFVADLPQVIYLVATDALRHEISIVHRVTLAGALCTSGSSWYSQSDPAGGLEPVHGWSDIFVSIIVSAS